MHAHRNWDHYHIQPAQEHRFLQKNTFLAPTLHEEHISLLPQIPKPSLSTINNLWTHIFLTALLQWKWMRDRCKFNPLGISFSVGMGCWLRTQKNIFVFVHFTRMQRSSKALLISKWLFIVASYQLQKAPCFHLIIVPPIKFSVNNHSVVHRSLVEFVQTMGPSENGPGTAHISSISQEQLSVDCPWWWQITIDTQCTLTDETGFKLYLR